MSFYADLHIHSKYSRATSRDCDLEHLAWWARRKGITVVGTGDFTHPAWFQEIRDKLVPAEPGLFRLRRDLEREVERSLPASCRGPMRFLLQVEISTIYKKGERTRKIHHLIYAPDLEVAARFRDRLATLGNIESDGRPILGLDSHHVLEVTLESGPGAYLIPAHVWTPWFAVLGSKSGFDSVEECYGDLAGHIFAVETGLSSDPPMNWRVSGLDRFTLVSNSDAHSPPRLGREACVFETELDYFALRRALETGEGYGGTVEFFPEEGKYHVDGHRACQVRLLPGETRRHGGRCPVCGKAVTVGVLHRVEELADRPPEQTPTAAAPFCSLVPLPEILAEVHGVGAKTKTVENHFASLVSRFGPELPILRDLPVEEVKLADEPILAEALVRLRSGQVRRKAGYDGEYGRIHLFDPGEISHGSLVAPLFDLGPVPAAPAAELEPQAPLASSHTTGLPPAGTAPESRVRNSRPEEPVPTVLAGLDPDQRAAASVLHGPLLIIAGPGTGKTRTLTHRIAHLITEGHAPPESCLALTFTRRAAEEMARRLQELLPGQGERVPVTTFHGLGLTLLREQRGELDLERGFRVANDVETQELAVELFGLPANKARRRLADLSQEKRRRAVSGDTAAASEPVARYEEALRERAWVDFDDLLILPLKLFTSESGSLLSTYQERYPWISIDEYQDIDALQYRLVRLLAPSHAHLCAIGDPDQSIYGFRGADVGFFLRFRRDYPDARTVQLTRNYRSNRVIVDAAVQAMAPATLVEDRILKAVDDGPARPVVVHSATSDRAEAEFVVRTMEELLGGTSHFSIDSGRALGSAGSHGGADDNAAPLSFDDFAVLYRTDAQSHVLVEALERSGIPFQKRSHQRLAHHTGVRRLLAVMAVMDAAKGPQRLPEGESPPTPGPEGASVLARLAAAVAALEGQAGREDATAQETAEILHPLARRYGQDLEGFLAEIALGAEVDTWDPRAERVSLLTLHAAKGLEFPVVFIVGCQEGLLPLRWGSQEENVDEERRLFFVGMTRARARLYLSHARQSRLRQGGVQEAVPSSFLKDIRDSLLDRHKEHRPRPRPQAAPVQLSLL